MFATLIFGTLEQVYYNNQINLCKHLSIIASYSFRIVLVWVSHIVLKITSQFIGVVLSSKILLKKYNADFDQGKARLTMVHLNLTMAGSHDKTPKYGNIPWLALMIISQEFDIKALLDIHIQIRYILKDIHLIAILPSKFRQ